MALYGTALKDMMGTEFVVGQSVARAVTSGRSSYIEIRTVTKIEGKKMYLDDSKVAIRYPSRMLIL